MLIVKAHIVCELMELWRLAMALELHGKVRRSVFRCAAQEPDAKGR